jgi:WD40 repeat protein
VGGFQRVSFDLGAGRSVEGQPLNPLLCRFCVKTFSGHSEWVRGVIPSSDGRQLVSCSVDQVGRLSRCLSPNDLLTPLFVCRHHGFGMLRPERPRRSYEDTSTSSRLPSSHQSPPTPPSASSLASPYVGSARKLRAHRSLTLSRPLAGSTGWCRCEAGRKLRRYRLSRQDDQAVGHGERPMPQDSCTSVSPCLEIKSVDLLLLYRSAVSSRLRRLSLQAADLSPPTDDNWIRALVFHPSGNFLLSAADDKTIRTWDLHTGRCIKPLEAHSHFVTCLAWGRAPAPGASAPPSNGVANGVNGAPATEVQLVNVIATGSVDQAVKVSRPRS